MQPMKTWFKYKVLKKPFVLNCANDSGQGRPVVFLHGIASSSEVWNRTIKLLSPNQFRSVSLDLLGFGQSVKPSNWWLKYNPTDHARSVIATLDSLNITTPAIFVGHSMGCLVSIEVAKLRPDLVSKLILFAPPFYNGLPHSKLLKFRKTVYFRLYRAVTNNKPKSLDKFMPVKNLLQKELGFELHEHTWTPFKRSLENTIIKQHSLSDLKTINAPTKIYYGKLDPLTINDKNNKFFKEQNDRIYSQEVLVGHTISTKISSVVAQEIEQSL